MDGSPPSSSVHGILQARILEWVAISFSRGSSQSRDQTQVSWVSCTGGQILFTTEPPGKPYKNNAHILTNKDFLFIETWDSTWMYHIVSDPLWSILFVSMFSAATNTTSMNNQVQA